MSRIKRKKEKATPLQLDKETERELICELRKILASPSLFLSIPSISPDNWSMPEIQSFSQTGKPEHLEEAIRKKGLSLLTDPGIRRWFDFWRGWLYIPSLWKHERENLLHKCIYDSLAYILGPENDQNQTIHWFVGKDILFTYLPKICEEYIDAIPKGLKPKDKAGRSKKYASWVNQYYLRTRWENFRNEGMKVLEPRFRYKREKSKALYKFIQTKAPNRIASEDIGDLVECIRKKEPLLKILFGYLTGEIEPPKKKKL